MIGNIRTVFLLSLFVHVIVSGYQGNKDQDGYLEDLLERVLDLQDRIMTKSNRVDDLSSARKGLKHEMYVDEYAKAAFQNMRLRHMYSWIILKITDDKKRIVVESAKESGSFEDFVEMLTESGDCRYALYATPEEWDQFELGRVVFVAWAPDDAPILNQIIYSYSKDTAKESFVGIKGSIKVNLKNEIKPKLLELLNKPY